MNLENVENVIRAYLFRRPTADDSLRCLYKLFRTLNPHVCPVRLQFQTKWKIPRHNEFSAVNSMWNEKSMHITSSSSCHELHAKKKIKNSSARAHINILATNSIDFNLPQNSFKMVFNWIAPNNRETELRTTAKRTHEPPHEICNMHTKKQQQKYVRHRWDMTAAAHTNRFHKQLLSRLHENDYPFMLRL